MTNTTDGGEAVVQAFRTLGFDYVMASPGSEWGGVWEAFARQKVSNAPGPEYLSCAHETLAVDLAIGYTLVTGRPQGVMLHTGVGLLQGAMGIDAAQRTNIPMVVMSGEALTYGEKDGFDPGGQWQANLSVVGGPHRLAEPLVKWSTQAASVDTLYHQVVAAGEMAQRTPAGPTFLTVPIETQLEEWTPPDALRSAPLAPKVHAPREDIERLAGMLAQAVNPVIITESSGRDPDGFAALIELAELLAIPVINPRQAFFANFPKDHPLYQGMGKRDYLDEADLLLTLRCRAPWYPMSDRPAKATIVAIDEIPFRPHMVHHGSYADMFLEGYVPATLTQLAEAARAAGLDSGAIEARRGRWAGAHEEMVARLRKAEVDAAARDIIHPITLFATMGKVLPEDSIYVDETITHRGVLQQHLMNKGPQSYFRPGGGLGQGLGVSLGIKLAAGDRPVVAIEGDGSFMYNPIVQSLALSRHRELPIMIVISNNNGYNAMRKEHQAFYPEGASAEHKIYPGHPVNGVNYDELAAPFGGFGRRVEKPGELVPALEEGLEAIRAGRTAIIDVQVDP